MNAVHGSQRKLLLLNLLDQPCLRWTSSKTASSTTFDYFLACCSMVQLPVSLSRALHFTLYSSSPYNSLDMISDVDGTGPVTGTYTWAVRGGLISKIRDYHKFAITATRNTLTYRLLNTRSPSFPKSSLPPSDLSFGSPKPVLSFPTSSSYHPS